MGPTSPPPTLCARFQVAKMVPRSWSENQCVSVRAQGGQPMPCAQPLANHRMNIMVTDPAKLGKARLTMPDSSRPVAMK